jgi:hypothetical protein
MRPKVRGQSESLKVSKLLPFFAFFFFVCFSFLLLEKKKMLRKKRLKQKGRNMRPKMGAKSEKAEQELESKLPPFFAFFFCMRRRKCYEKTFEIEGQK